MKSQDNLIAIDDIKNRMLMVRGNPALLDRDVAALYGVATREINQALRNNPDKFPAGYVVQLNSEEFTDWKSKFLTSNSSEAEKAAVKMGMRRAPYAFTERGLYMLATILKGERAVQTTIKIIWQPSPQSSRYTRAPGCGAKSRPLRPLASRADFVNKYSIALKEANETHYWLDLLKETNYLPADNATASLMRECKSIIAILVSSIKTAKGVK